MIENKREVTESIEYELADIDEVLERLQEIVPDKTFVNARRIGGPTGMYANKTYAVKSRFVDDFHYGLKTSPDAALSTIHYGMLASELRGHDTLLLYAIVYRPPNAIDPITFEQIGGSFILRYAVL